MTAPTVLVTGAARRIGAALAWALAADGHDIHLHTGHDHAGIDRLAAEIAAATGVHTTAHTVDLTNLSATTAWAQDLRTHARPPRIVINNASAFPATARTDQAHEVMTALRLHLAAPMTLLTALPGDGSAQVVNILDARLHLHDAHRSAYELGKHALATHTLLAAKHLAPRIRVNAVAPGLVLPPPGGTRDDLARMAHERAALGRPADLEDVVAAVRFLLRTASITGQILYVDAGEHLGPPPRTTLATVNTSAPDAD